MSFVSLEYLVFFILVFATYWRLPHKWQSPFLLLGSWTFYAAWDWRFLSFIIASTLADFVTGHRIRTG